MGAELKLGLNTGYWGAGPPDGAVEAIAAADELGFDSIWTAEAYGSDALTPLAWWGSATRNVRLGTAIMQMSARQPTATAMAAMTMDHLSGGRFILGLGVSGPQVVEGWYGQPFAKPLARTREYVGIVRDVFARQAPVTSDGPYYPIPLTEGERVTGLGKALKSTIHPVRDRHPDLPRRGGTEEHRARPPRSPTAGTRSSTRPTTTDFYRDALAEGFAREGARRSARGLRGRRDRAR